MPTHSCQIDSGVLRRQHINAIWKEIFRKSIHICGAALPFFMGRFYWIVIAALFLSILLYSASEFARLSGHEIPLVSSITAVAAQRPKGGDSDHYPLMVTFDIDVDKQAEKNDE